LARIFNKVFAFYTGKLVKWTLSPIGYDFVDIYG
jgi:hypothetical protein